MKIMDCCVFEEKLSEYLDGLLARPDASRFRAHALQCRECRTLLDEVKTALSDCKHSEAETPLDLETALLMIPLEHTPIDCDGFHELITEFLDGFVPAITYHRFEEHANECEECSQLLTSIVYAVAACHSVHTYEEIAVPDRLIRKLDRIMLKREQAVIKRIANRVSAFAANALTRPTQSARWRFATAASLAFATIAFLFLGFSDDGSVKGIFRQAQEKADDIYNQGAPIYQTTGDVMAGFEQAGKGLGQIWSISDAESEAGSEMTQPKNNQNANRPPERIDKN